MPPINRTLLNDDLEEIDGIGFHMQMQSLPAYHWTICEKLYSPAILISVLSNIRYW